MSTSASTSWLPGPRDDQLTMCQNWINYMTSTRRTAWGIPAAQFTELGLREKAEGSDIPVPNGQPTADVGYPDPGVIDILNIRPRQAHSTDPRSDYGVAIKLGIVGGTAPYHIDAPPAADMGVTLPFYKFTRRKRERFDFSGNSGKTLCVSLAYENGKGEEGPYCTVITVTIP